MTKLWQATLETRNFSFEAYGATEDEALSALKAGCTKHAKQYQIEDGFASVEQVAMREISIGTCYRDREALCVS